MIYTALTLADNIEGYRAEPIVNAIEVDIGLNPAAYPLGAQVPKPSTLRRALERGGLLAPLALEQQEEAQTRIKIKTVVQSAPLSTVVTATQSTSSAASTAPSTISAPSQPTVQSLAQAAPVQQTARQALMSASSTQFVAMMSAAGFVPAQPTASTSSIVTQAPISSSVTAPSLAVSQTAPAISFAPSATSSASSSQASASTSSTTRKRPASSAPLLQQLLPKRALVVPPTPFDLRAWLASLSPQEKANHIQILTRVASDAAQKGPNRLKSLSVIKAIKGQTYQEIQYSNYDDIQEDSTLGHSIPMSEDILKKLCHCYSLGGIALLKAFPTHNLAAVTLPIPLMHAILTISATFTGSNSRDRIGFITTKVNQMIGNGDFAPEHTAELTPRRVRDFLSRCE